jgi:hypothetical protein
MRLAKSILIALTALAVLASPAFAKNTKATPKADVEEDASPACFSYQLGPDGNWAQLPCQELGTRSPPQQHRAPPKPHEEEAR